MITKQKWPRAIALRVAEEIIERLRPSCSEIIIAGSLRRGRREVGDAEILFIPRIVSEPLDMFSTVAVSLADKELNRMISDETISKRPSKNGQTVWGDKNKLATHHSGVPVDFFSTTLESWFNYIVCRTGPADSNIRIATAAKKLGYTWNPYGTGFTSQADGSVIPMPNESAVFEFVGMSCLPPEHRK